MIFKLWPNFVKIHENMELRCQKQTFLTTNSNWAEGKKPWPKFQKLKQRRRRIWSSETIKTNFDYLKKKFWPMHLLQYLKKSCFFSSDRLLLIVKKVCFWHPSSIFWLFFYKKWGQNLEIKESQSIHFAFLQILRPVSSSWSKNCGLCFRPTKLI